MTNVRNVKPVDVGSHYRWADRAACWDHRHPRWWTDEPVGPRNELTAGARQALAVCSGCPVRRECLDAALEESAQIGIWGGTLPLERKTATIARAAQRQRFGIEEVAS